MTIILSPELSMREAARGLRVSVNTLKRWIEEGRLPEAHQEGRRWYVPVTGIERAQAAGWSVRAVMSVAGGWAGETAAGPTYDRLTQKGGAAG